MTREQSSELETVGILGAGKSGMAIARLALSAGYRVLVAGSGDPGNIALTIEVLARGATAVTAERVARESELVVLAMPLAKYRSAPVVALAGRIVIDVMNYWPPTDGVIAEFEDAARTSSEIVQSFLPASHVVKAFNHIGYHEMEIDARPSGAADRAALALAGDDPGALATVAAFIDAVGFDPVSVGQLDQGVRFQPGTPPFGIRLTEERLISALAGVPA
jgi:predicted dinucleotide-binding enzyme